jgi:hypothetical protein
MACRLPPHYTDVNFISRYFAVAYAADFGLLPVPKAAFAPIEVKFHEKDATALSITHHNFNNTSIENKMNDITLSPGKGDFLMYTWDSERQKNRRGGFCTKFR